MLDKDERRGHSVRKIVNLLKELQVDFDKFIDDGMDIKTFQSDSSLIEKVALTSCQNKDLAKSIAKLFIDLGENVVINIQEGTKPYCDTSQHEGIAFNSGIIHPFFATDVVGRKAELDNPVVVLCGNPIRTANEMAEILLTAVQRNRSPLVLVAPEFSDQAISIMLKNHQEGKVTVAPIVPLGTKEEKLQIIADLEIIGDAEDAFCVDQNGEKRYIINAKMFGSSGTVSSPKQTIIKIPRDITEECAKEKEFIIKQLAESASELEKDRLKRRLALYGGGYAEINIGGSTPAEVEELKLRAEDAVLAVKAAYKEGVTEGGGVPFKAFQSLSGNKDFSELGEALSDVYGLIQANIDKNTEKVDAYDPVAVIRHSLRNAVSIVKTAITTGTIIYKDEDKT
jgi:chaperonin GroEL